MSKIVITTIITYDKLIHNKDNNQLNLPFECIVLKMNKHVCKLRLYSTKQSRHK